MSRIGKKPINIPTGVTVNLNGRDLTVKGPKGELKQNIHPRVTLEIQDNVINLKIANENNKSERALWGLFGSLVNNMVIGVTKGFEKKLLINGIGYKANLAANKLNLSIGYSHDVVFEVPSDVTVAVEKNQITVSGIDKQRVGEVAAQIRKFKKPEPYKGKGIQYIDEKIRRKVGKAAGKGE